MCGDCSKLLLLKQQPTCIMCRAPVLAAFMSAHQIAPSGAVPPLSVSEARQATAAAVARITSDDGYPSSIAALATLAAAVPDEPAAKWIKESVLIIEKRSYMAAAGFAAAVLRAGPLQPKATNAALAMLRRHLLGEHAVKDNGPLAVAAMAAHPEHLTVQLHGLVILCNEFCEGGYVRWSGRAPEGLSNEIKHDMAAVIARAMLKHCQEAPLQPSSPPAYEPRSNKRVLRSGAKGAATDPAASSAIGMRRSLQFNGARFLGEQCESAADAAAVAAAGGAQALLQARHCNDPLNSPLDTHLTCPLR